jgi:hypothetical protein
MCLAGKICETFGPKLNGGQKPALVKRQTANRETADVKRERVPPIWAVRLLADSW